MGTIFLTGFPGFLGSELLPRILQRNPPDVSATCLVQAKFMPLARERAAEIEQAHPAVAGRIHLLEGDITRADLGLANGRSTREETVEVYHLAAVYDLAVRRELAMRVNVDGTHHVLEYAAGCPNLRRFHHVSTCFVSGRYPGVFRETDLQKGQSFNNHYEETKYLSEVEVQQRMREGMPGTIYRPSIVVGDSATGATQKYDGPYFVMQLLLRQMRYAFLPTIGNPECTRVNVAPRDFVIEALGYLSGLERSKGKVYALCDPNAPTASEMIETIGKATGRNLIKVPMPAWLAKNAISHGPGVGRLMRIPAEALDYFVHPTYYTCDNTLADLEGTNIRCPSFDEYAPRLVAYMRAHPEVGAQPMV